MRAEEARLFVAGKNFDFTCFEGTTGNGRIYPMARWRAPSIPAAKAAPLSGAADRHVADERRPILCVGPRPAVRALLQPRPHQPGGFRGSCRASALPTAISWRRSTRAHLQPHRPIGCAASALGGRRRLAAAFQSSPWPLILDGSLNLNCAHANARGFCVRRRHAVCPPHHARGWERRGALEVHRLRRARPERRARISRRSIAAILTPGPCFRGRMGPFSGRPGPAAFAPVRPSRVRAAAGEP